MLTFIHARAMVMATTKLLTTCMTSLHRWWALAVVFETTRATFHLAVRTTS